MWGGWGDKRVDMWGADDPRHPHPFSKQLLHAPPPPPHTHTQTPPSLSLPTSLPSLTPISWATRAATDIAATRLWKGPEGGRTAAEQQQQQQRSQSRALGTLLRCLPSLPLNLHPRCNPLTSLFIYFLPRLGWLAHPVSQYPAPHAGLPRPSGAPTWAVCSQSCPAWSSQPRGGTAWQGGPKCGRCGRKGV